MRLKNLLRLNFFQADYVELVPRQRIVSALPEKKTNPLKKILSVAFHSIPSNSNDGSDSA